MGNLTKPILPPLVLPLSIEAERELAALTLAFPNVPVDELMSALNYGANSVLWIDPVLGYHVQLYCQASNSRVFELYTGATELSLRPRSPAVACRCTSGEVLFRWLREQLGALREADRWTRTA